MFNYLTFVQVVSFGRPTDLASISWRSLNNRIRHGSLVHLTALWSLLLGDFEPEQILITRWRVLVDILILNLLPLSPRLLPRFGSSGPVLGGYEGGEGEEEEDGEEALHALHGLHTPQWLWLWGGKSWLRPETRQARIVMVTLDCLVFSAIDYNIMYNALSCRKVKCKKYEIQSGLWIVVIKPGLWAIIIIILR